MRLATTSSWHIAMPLGAVHPNTKVSFTYAKRELILNAKDR
ncbi:hypothetical protein SPHINGO391_410128 [Sphingomonas aurantiaca]|uniref:Uncharacterized protein n=1 Tax=Sphingomonas aurantiaca TaxID=185949 RepID=A0A5E7YYC9_9SPHN|nr:hypothetical protein SPHINGO391_410128 [Sphingomonas aurantiaca]